MLTYFPVPSPQVIEIPDHHWFSTIANYTDCPVVV